MNDQEKKGELCKIILLSQLKKKKINARKFIQGVKRENLAKRIGNFGSYILCW